MKLSDQALGCVMMALQKSILQQVDITEMLKEFEFKLTEDGLWIANPPLVKYGHAAADEEIPNDKAEGEEEE